MHTKTLTIEVLYISKKKSKILNLVKLATQLIKHKIKNF